MDPGNPPTLAVVAAVLKDAQGRVLVNQRPAGKPWAGYWEFPGGKIEAGETPRAALERELHEELGLTVQAAQAWLQLSHDYPERRVELEVWRVRHYSGAAQAHEGQAFAWVRPEALGGLNLLPADAPIVKALRLPPQMLVTPAPGADREKFLRQLGNTLQHGVEFVQLRAPALAAAHADLARAVISLCREYGARVVLNADPELARELHADGVHLNGARLAQTKHRPIPREFLSGASCHDAAQVQRAQDLGLDYVILGPVLPTPSHPRAKPLGWEGFKSITALSQLPVYAIGGMRAEALVKARELGGYGVAGISGFWLG
ncbi:MAG: Nudix family hydrolase [Gammaproteobacteria bacterium]|nr:Nudix family hydrolase [Gammaproteobacteria bacterium]